MKILAGGPARELESDVFRLHLEGLEAQNVEIRHIHVPPLPEQSDTRWFPAAIDRVAQARQTMMEAALGYDALLMVDTDVIMGPGALERMWAVDAPVVYGVFWSLWPGFEIPLPQVWNVHPYGFTSDFPGAALKEGKPVRVYGGGACTLFRGDAFRSRYWPRIDGLDGAGGMWPGEDRTFCLGCCFLGIEQVAIDTKKIVHLYTEDQQKRLTEARKLVGL